MTGDEIEAISRKVYEALRDDVFRLPPRAAEYLAPFRGYMPPPVAIGYGKDYCMLYTYILDNGSFTIELQAPDGARLLTLVMSP